MKKNATPILVILALSFVATFFSCGKKEENSEPPTIELIAQQGFISTDTIAGPAATLNFMVNCKSNGTHVLTNFIVSSNGTRLIDEGINTEELLRDVVLTKNSDLVEVIEFRIRDINGGEASITVTVELDESAGDTEPVWFSNIVLDAQNAENARGFLSLTDGQTFTLEEAQNNQGSINLLYYFDTVDSDESTLSSPGANIDDPIIPLSGWTTRNTTRFISNSITQEGFEAISSVLFLVDSYTTTGNRKAKNLEVGDTYSFKDETRNKYGMFRVYSVDGEDQGEITISIVIQP